VEVSARSLISSKLASRQHRPRETLFRDLGPATPPQPATNLLESARAPASG
jgi:hypothetical protein